MMRQTVLIILVVLASCVRVRATTYYVSATGNSSNTGLTTGDPWPLTYALANAGSNNTIIALPGTYTGHWATGSPYQLISSQVKWQAILVDDSDTLPVFSFWPTNGHSTTLDGFQIYGSSKGPGVYSIANTTTVQNCWIHHCGTNNTVFGPNNGIEAHDLYGTTISNNLIEYCGTFTNGGWGSAIYINGTNITVVNNVMRYNQAGMEIYRDPGDNPNEGSLNVLVQNNLVYGNWKYAMIMGSQFGRSYLLENNTIIHSNGFNNVAFAYVGQVSPFLTLHCTNNILYAGPGVTFQTGSGTMDGDYNFMDSAHFTQANGATGGTPGFKNAGTGLFWLTSGSASRGIALGAASGLRDFFGNFQPPVTDAGAFQYNLVYAADTRTLDPSPVGGADYWFDLGYLRVGTTNHAAFDNEADIRAAVAAASDGDSVIIPAGACNVSNVIQSFNAINIYGSNAASTILYDCVTIQGSNPKTLAVFEFEATNTTKIRLNGLAIRGATNGFTRASPNQNGTVQFQGNNPQIRVDNCSFSLLSGRDLVVQGCSGVADHNSFLSTNNQMCFVGAKNLTGSADLWGDSSWTNPVQMGTSNAMYFENNTFEDLRVGGPGKNAVDSQFGARWVFRYNTCKNCNLGKHGTETGGRARGAYWSEVYSNTFTCDTDSRKQSVVLDIRSGTDVLFGNTETGFANHLARMDVNRSTDTFPSWGGANGTNPYDNNDPTGVFATGLHNGTNNANTLIDSTAAWTVNQWFGYTLVNTNTGRFSAIVSNSPTTISYLGSKDNLGISNPLVWTNGQGYQIYRVNDILDAPGRGACTVLMSNNPAQPLAWPSNAVAASYSWNNTLSGIDQIYSAYPHALENREFFNSTPKPGYTPFTYPHPLVTASPVTGPVIVVQPADTLLVSGSELDQSVLAIGQGLVYQWWLDAFTLTPPNWKQVSGATNSTLTIPNVLNSVYGTNFFTFVSVSNSTGLVYSRTTTVTLAQSPWAVSGSFKLSGGFNIK